MTVKASEDRACFDPRPAQPVVESVNGAVSGPAVGDADFPPSSELIGLGPTQVNDDALSDLLDVSVIEPDKLRPSKPSREADQEQGSVPHVLDAVPHRPEDLEQIVTKQRRSLILRCPAP